MDNSGLVMGAAAKSPKAEALGGWGKSAMGRFEASDPSKRRERCGCDLSHALSPVQQRGRFVGVGHFLVRNQIDNKKTCVGRV